MACLPLCFTKFPKGTKIAKQDGRLIIFYPMSLYFMDSTKFHNNWHNNEQYRYIKLLNAACGFFS